MSSHARLLGQIQRKQQMMRAQQGRGMTGATSQVLSGAGRGSAGGAGGAYGLQKNAAGALARMDAAYRARWGTGLVINDGGRSYEDQVRAWNAYQNGTGNLAARPGTSVHEQGRAVDFGGAIQNAGSAQHQWLQQVAGQYGFSWTGRTFSQVEPWHWEYVGS
jgi:LAS superfamily LD-carboxypeptidase LdcB